MKRTIIVNITDDSIGVENLPDDVVIEVRDYRSAQVELAWQGPEIERVMVGGHPPYVKYRFGEE